MADQGRNGTAGHKETPLPSAITPTAFERLVVKYPLVCCLTWLGFSILLTCLTSIFMRSGKLSFDQRGVWDVRSHEVQKQFDAFMLARDEIPVSESRFSMYMSRSQAMFPLHLLYYSEDGDDNFLTTKSLEWMKKVESKVISATKFSSKCMLQHGVDTAQASISFQGLDSNTNTVTADRSPANGTMLIFSGQSTVLHNGGLYIARLVGVANKFKLLFRDTKLRDIEVKFSTVNDISSGAQFIPTRTECAAADSILNMAYPAVAAQKQAMCNGFVPSQVIDDVAVLSKVCGCDSTSVVHASRPCQNDCSHAFGKKHTCMSTAYVVPGEKVSQDITYAHLAELCPNAPNLSVGEKQQYNAVRQNMLPDDWTCTSTGAIGPTNMVRSTFWFGGPLEGYTSIAGDSFSDQEDDMMDWAKKEFRKKTAEISRDANKDADGTARVVIMAPFMVRLVFQELMMGDGMLAFGSIWFVWMWTWCSTGSLLLASACIFETFISLPMAMATWGLVGQEWLGFLCVMMLFVILGIGADDVFVLVDAWKQSAQQGFGDDLQSRFSWAYRRARDAMMVTTLTTFFGFFAAGLSNVPSISGFGYFAALVVFWDYIMCITFFASVVVLYHKYFEQKNVCCAGRCASHMCCCPCPCLGFEDPRPMWKKFRIVIPFVLLLVLGIAASMFRPLFGCLLICGSLIFVYSIVSAQTNGKESRPVEKFFQEKYYPIIIRHKLKCLVSVLLIFVGCAVAVGLLLRLPTKEEPFLKEQHYLQRYLDSNSKFGNSGSVPISWVYVVFGIDKADALDRTGVDYQQPGTGWTQNQPDEPLGKVQYSDAARQAMVSATGQQEIFSVCDAIRFSPRMAIFDQSCEIVVHQGVGYQRFVPEKESLLQSGRLRKLSTGYYEVTDMTASLSSMSTGFCSIGVYCFMYPIRDYLVSFCKPSSGLKAKWVQARGAAYEKLCIDANNVPILGGDSAFPSSNLDAVVASEGFRLYEQIIIREDRLNNGMAYDERQREHMTNKIVENGKLKFAYIGVNGSIPLGEFPYSEQRKLYDHYKEFFDARLTVTNGYFSTFIFNWMFITEALLTNTIQSMCLGVAFCFVVATLMTWNLLVSFIVVFSVIIVVTMAVGFIVLMGWRLGIIEAIVLIVIVGISVDYSVHIAHAFNHAEESTDKTNAKIREDKAYVAVGSMGISLLSGLATSLGAAIFLWFCQVSFFRKFGQFLMVTLAISFIVTFLCLIPMLLTFGPVKGAGVLPTLPCWKTLKEKFRISSASQQKAVEGAQVGKSTNDV